MPGDAQFREFRFPRFDDRRSAGTALARLLRSYRRRAGAVVLGLPRGGVLTADEVARELELPLDVLVIRKLRAPGREDLPLGAIGSNGIRTLNTSSVEALRIPPWQMEALAEDELREVRRREKLYRGDLPPLDLLGRVVIIVDDGIATGSTMRAAIDVVRDAHAARIVVAVPVAPADTCDDIARSAHEMICLATPMPFGSICDWYRDFAPVTDLAVVEVLERGRLRAASDTLAGV